MSDLPELANTFASGGVDDEEWATRERGKKALDLLQRLCIRNMRIIGAQTSSFACPCCGEALSPSPNIVWPHKWDCELAELIDAPKGSVDDIDAL